MFRKALADLPSESLRTMMKSNAMKSWLDGKGPGSGPIQPGGRPKNHGTETICSHCVMDGTDPAITFDLEGVCNHCRAYEERAARELYTGEAGRARLKQLAEQIRIEGRGKEYDCVIGLSGGIDSTMVAYTVKQLGLRPIAVHLDNGWDSEVAVRNIENVVTGLGIDLHTHVIDWEEFRDLHVAFLKASVPNSEVTTDHAIVALLYRTAVTRGIRFIIGGGNIVTEAIMPSSWGYDARDWKHIKAVHRRFGRVRLRTFPHQTLFHWVYYTFVRRIKLISILNYLDYNKQAAESLLSREVGWQSYGPKHFESIYTRFFQGYILPTKFGYDKRKAHLSTLICSGQVTRASALQELTKDVYSREQLNEDREYLLKKLALGSVEFQQIMAQPPHTHRDYPSNEVFFDRMPRLLQFSKRVATAP